MAPFTRGSQLYSADDCCATFSDDETASIDSQEHGSTTASDGEKDECAAKDRGSQAKSPSEGGDHDSDLLNYDHILGTGGTQSKSQSHWSELDGGNSKDGASSFLPLGCKFDEEHTFSDESDDDRLCSDSDFHCNSTSGASPCKAQRFQIHGDDDDDDGDSDDDVASSDGDSESESSPQAWGHRDVLIRVNNQPAKLEDSKWYGENADDDDVDVDLVPKVECFQICDDDIADSDADSESECSPTDQCATPGSYRHQDVLIPTLRQATNVTTPTIVAPSGARKPRWTIANGQLRFRGTVL